MIKIGRHIVMLGELISKLEIRLCHMYHTCRRWYIFNILVWWRIRHGWKWQKSEEHFIGWILMPPVDSTIRVRAQGGIFDEDGRFIPRATTHTRKYLQKLAIEAEQREAAEHYDYIIHRRWMQ